MKGRRIYEGTAESYDEKKMVWLFILRKHPSNDSLLIVCQFLDTCFDQGKGDGVF
jgi:hypothetical protein